MKALVTGGNGFIGTELIKTLESKGFFLKLLSRQNIKNYDTIICNLGADKIPEHALEDVDMVFHLAGYTHDLVDLKSKDKLYYDVNVKASVELFKIAINKGVKKFIYLSSVKAGGLTLENKSMTEKDQGTPNDIYGLTKRTAEIEILELAKSSNIAVSIIRPSLVYGDEMKGNLGEMLKSIKSGWFPPLPETNNKRSMISVIDLVDAIVFIAFNQNSNGNIYIATDGTYYSSRDIYIVLCTLCGRRHSRWAFPKIFFSSLAFAGDYFKSIPFNSHKYNKLFGSECYSSKKLSRLGFMPKYNFESYINRYK